MPLRLVEPGSVKATVTDSNVYADPGSSWEMKAARPRRRSTVEMIWIREFRRDPEARSSERCSGSSGKPIFGRYARDTLENLHKLERSDQLPSR